MKQKTHKTILISATAVAAGSVATPIIYACLRNLRASIHPVNRHAVDELLSHRKIYTGNVVLPADTCGLLYNKGNRLYASEIIKADLGSQTKRTTKNISSEIFAHIFAADIVLPLRLFTGKLPPKYDIYSRVVCADIDEREKRIFIFNTIDRIFEHDN